MKNTEIAYLPDLFICPDFDGAKAIITFTPPKVFSGGSWKITAGKKTVASGKLAPTQNLISFEVALEKFTPWTPENPFLYALMLTLKAGRKEVQIEQSFGMRKIHTINRQIYLNNKPFYIRGVIRGREAHDHPNLCGLSEVEYYEKFINTLKQFGFNFIRFHSKTPPPAYFDVANRLGILTHIEVRKYFGKYQKERVRMDEDPVLVQPRDWKETILRVRNHASLIAYCLGNEISKPGQNPQVQARAEELRALDPTRLFIDTCAHGEYDRGIVDFDVQHMGYFAPFRKDYNMFDVTSNWAVFGSVDGKAMSHGSTEARTRREVEARVPVLAHEIGHIVAYRDLEGLRAKFKKYKMPEPWWLEELIKLRAQKGLEKDYAKLREASRRFQFIWHKQIFESIRKSPILCGFHFLQFSDTDRYENANGILDCFDDVKPGYDSNAYLQFNNDAVLVADLPRRAFFEGEKLSIPVWLSNCSHALSGEGTLAWTLKSKSGKKLNIAGSLNRIELREGLKKIVVIEVVMPKTSAGKDLELQIVLKPGKGKSVVNTWNLWLYPNRPWTLAIKKATALLRDVNLLKRHPQLTLSSDPKNSEKLMIVDRFTDDVFKHLEKGGDVLMLHRAPETRQRDAQPEKYYMPVTWDRFKGVIWDRGHNLGGFMRPHSALKIFPHDGFIDFQFTEIINDCDKFNLDDFPAVVEPIIQGADKMSRDRFDVHTFKLSELQSSWTMRKFAYLFDLRVGQGRLMMSAFNFTGLEKDTPEACAMFESLAACVVAPDWEPAAKISVPELMQYLAKKGGEPRIKERMMTQYWQLDNAPLESAQYWKDSEAWIRENK
ncbi:MAG: glycoside hydrolase family 2 TIM barrel-domain containing protein [Planctomycetota bacterium]